MSCVFVQGPESAVVNCEVYKLHTLSPISIVVFLFRKFDIFFQSFFISRIWLYWFILRLSFPPPAVIVSCLPLTFTVRCSHYWVPSDHWLRADLPLPSLPFSQSFFFPPVPLSHSLDCLLCSSLICFFSCHLSAFFVIHSVLLFDLFFQVLGSLHHSFLLILCLYKGRQKCLSLDVSAVISLPKDTEYFRLNYTLSAHSLPPLPPSPSLPVSLSPSHTHTHKQSI